MCEQKVIAIWKVVYQIGLWLDELHERLLG